MSALTIRVITFLLAPLAVMSFLELFVFSIDRFTFRSWEALTVDRNFLVLKGPFYPNARLARDEVGDLAPHTPDAVVKSVEWITDEDGYRKVPGGAAPEVVIIGDSMTAGSSLTQDDMLSEQLERRLRKPVYPLAPGGIRDFLQDRRFRGAPPGVLVYQNTERARSLRSIRWSRSRALRQALPNLPWLQRLAAGADRVFVKQAMLEAARARLRRALSSEAVAIRDALPGGGRPVYFIEGAEATREEHELEIPELVVRLLEYQEHVFASGSGTRFIFLPVPNKESIYPDLIPGGDGRRPRFVPRLVEALRAVGVETLDTQALLEAARTRRPERWLYHTDDSHWSPEGVRIIATELAELIQSGSASPNS